MKKLNIKKVSLIVIITMIINGAALYAKEDSDEVQVLGNTWSFMSGISFNLGPVSEQKPDDGSGGNHLAPITGVNIPVPFAQFVAVYTIPLDFGDNIIFSGANIQLVAGPSLTPVGLDTQAGIIFSPSPIINFGLAATIGSGWAIGSAHGIGLYNYSTNEYEQCTPFTVWKYDFIFQTQFQFDFGALFPGEWTHIIITTGEQIYYEGNTAAKNEELWEWAGSKDNVNGFQQAGNVFLGYMFPDKVFNMIGFVFAWQGHLSGDDFGIYDSNYDGAFKRLSVGCQAMFAVNDNNSIVLSTSFTGNRAFLEKVSPTESCITKTTSGREWYFDGITVQWAHTF